MDSTASMTYWTKISANNQLNPYEGRNWSYHRNDVPFEKNNCQVKIEDQTPYLELLKKVLIDYENIGSYEYYPLENVNPSWRTSILFPIDTLLRKRNFALCKIKLVTEESRINGLDWPAKAKTMIGMKRLNNIEYCIKTIIDEQIDGDFAETGIWRGGSTIFMKAVLNELGIKNKTIWLADSFQGVPKPNETAYSDDKGNKLHKLKILKVSKQEVENNFKKFDLLDENIRFLQGWFSSSLPQSPIEKLSLLRLDGDLYESTHLGLKYLYPKLSVGGFVIIDDYNAFPNCKKAVIDFRTKNQINEPILEIDKEAIFWKKEK
jgi:O-methyltransferase